MPVNLGCSSLIECLLQSLGISGWDWERPLSEALETAVNQSRQYKTRWTNGQMQHKATSEAGSLSQGATFIDPARVRPRLGMLLEGAIWTLG